MIQERSTWPTLCAKASLVQGKRSVQCEIWSSLGVQGGEVLRHQHSEGKWWKYNEIYLSTKQRLSHAAEESLWKLLHFVAFSYALWFLGGIFKTTTNGLWDVVISYDSYDHGFWNLVLFQQGWCEGVTFFRFSSQAALPFAQETTWVVCCWVLANGSAATWEAEMQWRWVLKRKALWVRSLNPSETSMHPLGCFGFVDLLHRLRPAFLKDVNKRPTPPLEAFGFSALSCRGDAALGATCRSTYQGRCLSLCRGHREWGGEDRGGLETSKAKTQNQSILGPVA